MGPLHRRSRQGAGQLRAADSLFHAEIHPEDIDQARPVPVWAVPGLVAAVFMAAQAAPAGVPGGTTSSVIGSRLPAVVTLTVWWGMVVNQSTRAKWPLSAVSRCGISSHSSRWTASRCTRTPGRASSAAIRAGSSERALRECGHHPPSTAPRRLSAGSKLTRADGGPGGIAEGVPPSAPDGLPAVLVLRWETADITAAGAPSSSSRAKARPSAASTSRRVRAVMVSPLVGPGRWRSGPVARIGHRQLPPDARHRERHEHGDDDDQADEDHGLLPSVTPG